MINFGSLIVLEQAVGMGGFNHDSMVLVELATVEVRYKFYVIFRKSKSSGEIDDLGWAQRNRCPPQILIRFPCWGGR